MQQKICAIIFILYQSFCFDLKAQENYDITYEDAAMKFGVFASPNGMGLFYRNSIPLQNKYNWCLDFSFTGVKQIKEKQVLNQRMVNTTPYIYGKVNRLYAFRPMLGLSKDLAEKQNKNSVGINAFALLGPTLGFLKPNYVNIEYFDPTNPNVVFAKSVRYNPEIYRFDQITGYSPFAHRINETKIIGGLSFKLGTEFNWGYYSSDYKSIEVGVLIDWFPSRPELLHFVQNKIVYSSFYVSFALGKNY
jgi:hypothetical protein